MADRLLPASFIEKFRQGVLAVPFDVFAEAAMAPLIVDGSGIGIVARMIEQARNRLFFVSPSALLSEILATDARRSIVYGKPSAIKTNGIAYATAVLEGVIHPILLRAVTFSSEELGEIIPRSGKISDDAARFALAWVEALFHRQNQSIFDAFSRWKPNGELQSPEDAYVSAQHRRGIRLIAVTAAAHRKIFPDIATVTPAAKELRAFGSLAELLTGPDRVSPDVVDQAIRELRDLGDQSYRHVFKAWGQEIRVEPPTGNVSRDQVMHFVNIVRPCIQNSLSTMTPSAAHSVPTSI